ncbi:hypothetical protein CDCA_CDCA14G3889 [Cyanidium caldarium]|uniref:Protein RFT1 homolog n=1 Tax=Cyanidium caldarium TaxID=2771 RepID=A0AAV9IZY6_CYACA|nr:hypothetical protein CDCA_CDCA14G3889 [Cyanidium caldarium]
MARSARRNGESTSGGRNEEREKRGRRPVEAASVALRTSAAWQVGARALSLGLRVAVARRFGPAAVAFADVNLYMLSAVALLPLREVVRRVALQGHAEALWQGMAVWWGCGWSVLVCGWFVSRAASIRQRALYAVSSVGVVLEAVLGEQYYVACTVSGDVRAARRRARADALAVLLHSVVTVAVSYASGDGLVGAACGSLAQSVALVAGWAFAARSVKVSREGVRREEMKNTSATCLSALLAHAAWQAGTKFLASDAENALLMSCARVNAEQVGSYKLAGNIASLLLRYWLLPLEESVYAVVSSSSSAEEALPYARCAFLTSLLPALLCATVGASYADVYTRLLYGKQPLTAQVLAWYLRYVAVAALLGTTEAYASTAVLPRAPRRALGVHALASGSISALYLVGVYVALYRFGDVALLVLANAAASLLRALLAWTYIEWLGRRDSSTRRVWACREALPSARVLGALAGLAAVVRWAGERAGEKLQVLVGAVGVLGWVWLVYHEHGGVLQCVLASGVHASGERK